MRLMDCARTENGVSAAREGLGFTGVADEGRRRDCIAHYFPSVRTTISPSTRPAPLGCDAARSTTRLTTRTPSLAQSTPLGLAERIGSHHQVGR